MSNTFFGTKGKWEVKHSESKDAFNVIGTVLGGKYKIARIPYEHKLEKEEAKANAQLISLAPDMLEILKKVLKKVDWSTYNWGSNHGRELEHDIEDLITRATTI